MNKQIFNKVYAKYFKKDYFGIKECLRYKLTWAKENNISYKYSDIKNYFKDERIKAYNMMLKRIEERKQGKHFPLREKFTHEIFKQIGI